MGSLKGVTAKVLGVALVVTVGVGYDYPDEIAYPDARDAVLAGKGRTKKDCADYLRHKKPGSGHIVEKKDGYYCYYCPDKDWLFLYNPKQHRYQCLKCRNPRFSIEKDLYYNPVRFAYVCVRCPDNGIEYQIQFWKRGRVFVCLKPGEKLRGQ